MQHKSRRSMEERGKAVETYSMKNSLSSLHHPCNKHPFSSPVGICARCLRDKLMELVCSDHSGQQEQRQSSWSCSEFSSYLTENENIETKDLKSNKFILLKSRSTGGKYGGIKSSKIWEILKLLRRKRDKPGCEQNTEKWMFDYAGVSKSRSLRSFRRGSLQNPQEESDFSFSSTKISEPSECVLPVKESIEVCGVDELGFIDLTFDTGTAEGGSFSSVADEGRRKGPRGGKVWRWIFRQHSDRVSAGKRTKSMD